jgi:hypothetical protein
LKVDVLVASCCTPVEVQSKILSTLEGLKREIPDLEWDILDVERDPEIAIKFRAPMTPAIFIDGNLAVMGYPKEGLLETKVREKYG